MLKKVLVVSEAI